MYILVFYFVTGINARILIGIDQHWALIEGVLTIWRGSGIIPSRYPLIFATILLFFFCNEENERDFTMPQRDHFHMEGPFSCSQAGFTGNPASLAPWRKKNGQYFTTISFISEKNLTSIPIWITLSFTISFNNKFYLCIIWVNKYIYICYILRTKDGQFHIDHLFKYMQVSNIINDFWMDDLILSILKE